MRMFSNYTVLKKKGVWSREFLVDTDDCNKCWYVISVGNKCA